DHGSATPRDEALTDLSKKGHTPVMIKLVEEVGQQNQIEPAAPVYFECATRQRVIALRHPGRLGALSCNRKDARPIYGRDFRARNGSCNRNTKHTVARGDIEHLARRPARQL